MSIQTINPANGQILKTYKEMSSTEVDRILALTQKAWTQWKTQSYKARGLILKKIAATLRAQAPKAAKLISQEMGKPITLALAEIEKCAWVCDYYAKETATFLAPRVVKTQTRASYVHYEPLGIVFAILPWNFPFWQVFRCLAPALMAGSAMVLSHAPISTGVSLLIEKLLQEAGLPKHLFRALVIGIEESARLIAHPHIIGISLTASEKTGREVAAKAGAALKPIMLELGGSDAYVILEDADIKAAAEICVSARLSNSGQVCSSPKRLIVTAKVKAAFEAAVLAKMQSYTYGDPLHPETLMGPIARSDLRDQLHRQVMATVKEGGRLLLGGRMPEGPGFYYPPTLLTEVTAAMTAFQEELFGPVVCIIPAKNEREAIALANLSRYGLDAAVFTKNTKKGEKIARDLLQAGSVAVNMAVTSDPRLPYGGIKASGHGRELSREGLLEFVNIKSIWVK